MWADLGANVRIAVLVDASAALGIIERKGFGKVRHIQTNNLWIQEIAAKRQVKFGKVKCQENLADPVAKELLAAAIRKHIERIGTEFLIARANFAAGIDDIQDMEHVSEDMAREGSGTPKVVDRPGELTPARLGLGKPAGWRHK